MLRERGFNPSYVGNAIETYKDTITFAKLDASGIIDEDETTSNDPIDAPLMDSGKQKGSITLPSDAPTSTIVLDEGNAYFTCPTDISKDSFYDLEAGLEAAMNRLARLAGVDRKKK